MLCAANRKRHQINGTVKTVPLKLLGAMQFLAFWTCAIMLLLCFSVKDGFFIRRIQEMKVSGALK